ncbi:murein biosynthesis integral membrane protein MurJ [Metallumcola ferriviriculae]|uniref:Probable lipid II flippase MurJ n=1 Tax=Metallumcola ferriviriculae TaxID=3039180 RepID=A0AAU0UM38_9FIRM|nr:murein biosynthesis integral membrane protein MurJ [Desulfitibacteraceae bacterium MK1]
MTEKRGGVARAAGMIMVAMVISRILGYLRDVIIYAQFGQNRITDAYRAAFSIPDFLYMLLVGGALSSAFIPVISSLVAKEREEEVWYTASVILNVIMVLMVVGIAIGMVFTPQLIGILVPGFKGESFNLTVSLTRIMFFQAFFMALNGISTGILNSYRHFFSPALGSVLYNLAIIVVGLLLQPYIGIAGFSIGVVIGAMINFSVQIPALMRLGVRYRPAWNIRHPEVKKIVVLMLPVLVGLSVTQFNLFVNQNLASTLAPGIVAALAAGQRLMQLPIGIFGIAVAVAVFPTLTAHSALDEKAAFKRTMSLGIRSVIFLTLPAAVGLVALRTPIIRVLFEWGKFTHNDTVAIAEALFYYSFGLFAYSANQVLNRVFYALHDTRTPVTAAVATIAINIGLSFLLIGPLQHGGLALAYSVAGVVNMVLLLGILRHKIGSINGRQLVSSFFISLFASLLMGAASYFTAWNADRLLDMTVKFNQLIQVTAAVAVGAVVYAVLALLFHLEEADMVMDIFRRRLKRRRGAGA